MALLLIVLYTSNKQYAFLININIILSIYIQSRVRVRANAVPRTPGRLGRKRPQVRSNMALLLIVLYTSNNQYAFLININIILSIYILYRVRVRVRANAVLRSPGGLGGGSAPRLGLIWPYYHLFYILPIINIRFK